MKKMLMNPYTGNVASETEWRKDFESMPMEQWGAETFEAAGLVLVKLVDGVWTEDGIDD